jgi:hypothetical protein
MNATRFDAVARLVAKRRHDQKAPGHLAKVGPDSPPALPR